LRRLGEEERHKDRRGERDIDMDLSDHKLSNTNNTSSHFITSHHIS
jgi:hypothetical protein